MTTRKTVLFQDKKKKSIYLFHILTTLKVFCLYPDIQYKQTFAAPPNSVLFVCAQLTNIVVIIWLILSKSDGGKIS